MKQIFLIKKLWYDPLENRNAWGYNPVGFVEDKDLCDKIVTSEFIDKSVSPWPLAYIVNGSDKIPVYICEIINEFNLTSLKGQNEKTSG